MQEINTLENNLNKQVDNINMNIQRNKGTPVETKKKNKRKKKFFGSSLGKKQYSSG